MITRLLTVAALAAAFVAVPGAHAAPAPFHDNFDGVVASSLTHGLNDNLKQRQGTGAVTYTRVAGDHAEVTRSGKLSMRSGTTAVRLDAPSTGSAISATLTPAGASDGWSSIVLSRSANITGHVSDQAVDLGFLVHANGSVQVLQPGHQPLAVWATPKRDGSFDVTLKLAGTVLDLTVNGRSRQITLGTEVPTDRLWVYLGSQAAGLVDDLEIEALNSDHLRKRPGATLRYYGYLGAGPAAVHGHSNLNLIEVGAHHEVAAEQRFDGFVVRDAATARQVKKLFPGKKVMLVVAGSEIDDTFRVPSEVDWVGFHQYCAGYAELEERMLKLEERAPGKELFLLPEGSPQPPCADRTDADLESTQYLYLALAQQYPSFAGFLVTPVAPGFARTADAQERVAALVLGDARLSG